MQESGHLPNNQYFIDYTIGLWLRLGMQYGIPPVWPRDMRHFANLFDCFLYDMLTSYGYQHQYILQNDPVPFAPALLRYLHRSYSSACPCMPLRHSDSCEIAHPAAPPLSASCPSGQYFACGFLQIPPCDGHPCRSANTSLCRVCRGLSPPSHLPHHHSGANSASHGATRHAWRTQKKQAVGNGLKGGEQ